MMSILDRLRAIEERKRGVPTGTDEFVALAREAEDLSRVVVRWSGLQLQLAEASPTAVLRGEMARMPLDEVEPQPLDRILASWREAQIRFEVALPGSPEAARAADDVARFRQEFQRAQNLKH